MTSQFEQGEVVRLFERLDVRRERDHVRPTRRDQHE